MIRWGFLGAGWIAQTALAPALHAANNATLHAVASRDTERSGALNPTRVHKRYEDLLDDPEIDAVYINLSNEAHYQWAIAALKAGKHVLCEKPLALNHAQAQEMADAAKKHNRVLTEAVWHQWHPRFVRIRELIQRGDLGALSSIDSSFCFTGNFENNYRLDPQKGGGSLLDVGVYQVHVWSALNPQNDVVNIQSVNRTMSSTGVDMTTQVSAELGNGVRVKALSSFEMPETQSIVISTEQATIECLGNDAFTSWNKPSSMRIANQIEEFAPVDPYRLMIENFSDHISDKPAWILGLEQSLYVSQVLDQIKEFRTKR
jgi:D-xylose 1-dehydrogenase (NADP+, D-xylono-1,5-lactone-forming)